MPTGYFDLDVTSYDVPNDAGQEPSEVQSDTFVQYLYWQLKSIETLDHNKNIYNLTSMLEHYLLLSFQRRQNLKILTTEGAFFF